MKIRKLCELLDIPIKNVFYVKLNKYYIQFDVLLKNDWKIKFKYYHLTHICKMTINTKDSMLFTNIITFNLYDNEIPIDGIINHPKTNEFYIYLNIRYHIKDFIDIFNNGMLFEILNYDDDINEYQLNIPVYYLDIYYNSGESWIYDESDNIIHSDYKLKFGKLFTDKFEHLNYLNNGIRLNSKIHFKSKSDLLRYYMDSKNHIKFFQGVQIGEYYFIDLEYFISSMDSMIS